MIIFWLVHYLLCGNTANIHFLKTRAVYWVDMAVMTSIDWMAPHCGDYYYPEIAGTVKVIFKNIFIGIIK